MNLALITQRIDIDPAHGERRDTLDQRWAGFLAACQAMAVPVPNRAGTALGLADTIKPDLIIFSGGNDLTAYGGHTPERDETELALLGWARANRVPVLGVCRGMQLILHAFEIPLKAVDGHVASRHLITGDGMRREVNSYHRLAAATPIATATGLTVRARSEDGIVEAISHPTEAVTGIMWHPEREPCPDPADIALIQGLLTMGRTSA